eukprot:TRINITY_DN1022_c1_g2_i1.p1 TRINITY_DN1022_c1_g2~~TRINITY_DN1022_c1_g2_i1.p1  ORF type:complete len:1331 (+),score=426.58 TRINITY_DN1022_c1_g2_i1:57-3995(+)
MAAKPAQLKYWRNSLRSPPRTGSQSPTAPASGAWQRSQTPPARQPPLRSALQRSCTPPNTLSRGNRASNRASVCLTDLPALSRLRTADSLGAEVGSVLPRCGSAAQRAILTVFGTDAKPQQQPRYMRTTQSLSATKYVDGAGLEDRLEYCNTVRWPQSPPSPRRGAASQTPSPARGGRGVAWSEHGSDADINASQDWAAAAEGMAQMALEAYGWESEEHLVYQEFLTMLDDIEPDVSAGQWLTREVLETCLRGRGEDPSGPVSRAVLTDVFLEWFHQESRVLYRLQRLLESQSQDSKSLRSMRSAETETPHYMRPTKSFIQSSPKLIEEQDAKEEKAKRRKEREEQRRAKREGPRSASGRLKRPIRKRMTRLEDDYRVGDAVVVRDKEADAWRAGTVKGFQASRPLVQLNRYPDGKPHLWRFVKKAAQKEPQKRAAAAGGARRALLIGVDYLSGVPDPPPPSSELAGCIQDTKRMERMILRRGYGFETRVLSDDIDRCMPTKSNIMESLRWLVEGSSDGDSLLLSFSGRNGVQLPEDPRPEDLQIPEAIAPCDYARHGLIAGTELLGTLLSGLHPGARLTLVADCAHGGGVCCLPHTVAAQRAGDFTLAEDGGVDGSGVGHVTVVETAAGDAAKTRVVAQCSEEARAESGLVSAFIHATDKTPEPLVMPLLSELRALLKDKIGQDAPLPRIASTRRLDLGDRFTLGFQQQQPPPKPPPKPDAPSSVLNAETLRAVAREAAQAQAKQNRPRPTFDWRGFFGWLPPRARRAPDYSSPDAWLVNYGLGVGAEVQRWAPAGGTGKPDLVAQVREADCFFVHPTTVQRGWGNADWDEATAVTRDVVQQCASAFNGCCRIYSPKYRQARFQAYSCPAPSMQSQFDNAYADVRAAWDQYLSKHNPAGPSGRRPIVLAGHGQGSQHLVRLLQERPVEKSVVCAYLLGWQVGADALGHRLPFGKEPLQTRCWVSYSVGDESQGRPAAFGCPGIGSPSPSAHTTTAPLMVNPLSWKPDASPMPPLLHRGCLQQDGSLSTGGVLGTRIAATASGCPEIQVAVAKQAAWGAVFCDKDQRRQWLSLRLADLHEYDYQLFWQNLRENAEARVKAFIPPFLRHVMDGHDFFIHPVHGTDLVVSAGDAAGGSEVVEVPRKGGRGTHHRWRFVPVVAEGGVSWGHIESRADGRLCIDAGSEAARRREQVAKGVSETRKPTSPPRSPSPDGSPPQSPRRGAFVCLWPKMKGKAAERKHTQLWRVVRVDGGQRLVEFEMRGGRLLQTSSADGARLTAGRRCTRPSARQRFVISIPAGADVPDSSREGSFRR